MLSMKQTQFESLKYVGFSSINATDRNGELTDLSNYIELREFELESTKPSTSKTCASPSSLHYNRVD